MYVKLIHFFSWSLSYVSFLGPFSWSLFLVSFLDFFHVSYVMLIMSLLGLFSRFPVQVSFLGLFSWSLLQVSFLDLFHWCLFSFAGVKDKRHLHMRCHYLCHHTIFMLLNANPQFLCYDDKTISWVSFLGIIYRFFRQVSFLGFLICRSLLM